MDLTGSICFGIAESNFQLIVVILQDYEDFREDFKKLGLAFNSVESCTDLQHLSMIQQKIQAE